MVTEEMQNNFRKKDCVRKWKKVRETCLIHYKSERSAESPGQGEGGTAWEGPSSAEVGAQLVSMRWGCGVQGQRQVRQGGPVVALAEDLESFPV